MNTLTASTEPLIEDSWATEEATLVANEMLANHKDGYYSPDQLHQAILKERHHWIKVFGTDAQGQADMKRFADVFNGLCFETFNLAI